MYYGVFGWSLVVLLCPINFRLYIHFPSQQHTASSHIATPLIPLYIYTVCQGVIVHACPKRTFY